MRIFNWFGQVSRKNQTDELSRAIAGEQITIDWHEDDKQQTLKEIEYQRGLKAELSKLKWEPARIWNMQDRDEEINRLEHCIQWNERLIIHAKNNILYHSQRKQSRS